MKKIILFALCIFVSGAMFAQTTVTGTVIGSDDRNPIPFASVHVDGTTNLVFTDDDGKYSIGNVPGDGALIISVMGYVTQKVSVNGRAVINVELHPEAVQLDEAMVVAYGTATKGTYTGAASVVKADAIQDVPNTSFENALSGKIAGLQVTTSSGQAGSTPSIRIRGIGSMNASNEPLYVIDGVPVSSGNIGQMSDYTYSTNNVMNTLNPNDIESITVLKDAAASSLYGSRAANGVIMITTKKGKSGKPTVTFRASVGITPSWATRNYETASPQDQAQMEYEIFHDLRTTNGYTEAEANAYALSELNDRFNQHGYQFSTNDVGRYAHINITGMTDGQEDRTGKYYDWEDALFRTAVYQTYDLSVSGGTDNTTYYSSFAYTSDKGRSTFNDFSRISGRVNVTQKIGKHVEFATSVNIAQTKQTGYNDTRNVSSNMFMQTRNLLWPFYWPTDYKTGEPWTDRFGSLAYNLLYYDNEWDNLSKTFRVNASETLTIHIIDGLDLRSVFSYDNAETKDHVYYSANHFNASDTDGSVTDMSTQYSNWVSSTTLSYNKTFADKHVLSALVGFEAEERNTEFIRATGTFLPTSTLQTVSTAGVLDANSYSWGNSMASVLSRVEYSYDSRYYLSGSYRRDGSSRLSPEARWGNFWSVSGAWRINNENFLKDTEWISNLRLRASYGVNGTLPSDNYGWRSLVGYTYPYNGNPGGLLTNVANENLSWETNYTANVALEFGFFNQRLYGTIEWFNRDSKDLLQDVPISTITGFGSTLRNIGEINNKGWEIEIGGDIIQTEDVTWSASLTASMIKSKVTKLYDGQDIIWYDPTGSDSRCQYLYREGESTLAYYGYEWAGVDPATGQSVYYVNEFGADGEIDPSAGGDFMYNGRAATYDYGKANEVILGDANPKIYGGINTDVTWKGITLGLNFIYRLGATLYDAAEKDTDDDGYYWERIRSERVAENRWTSPGQKTVIPQIRGIDLEDAMQISSRHLHTGDFLRLKNITLSYNFPKAWVNKIGLGSARVYFNGQNLLTWSAFNEVDPEVNIYGTRGWETPIGKTYTFGLEFTF